jgi:hypothetical protein
MGRGCRKYIVPGTNVGGCRKYIVPGTNVDPAALDPAGLGRKKLCGSWFRNRARI